VVPARFRHGFFAPLSLDQEKMNWKVR
jgi:hypothetical protein